MSEFRNLYLPKKETEVDFKALHVKSAVEECDRIEFKSSVVIVGANGSGKTRLGTWLDLTSPYHEMAMRISAQKSLSMPDSVQPLSVDIAERDLLWGHPNSNLRGKAANKWSGEKAAIFALNDYQKLMVYLFSEQGEVSAKYLNDARLTESRIKPPITKLEMIKRVWESLLPHRELIIGGAKIETKIRGADGGVYNSSEMSDGERVVFYLIAQCLAAPKDGIIIVDEPELHLHKSLQYHLWKEVEALRSDCVFVYITHDVEFAATQTEAKKIWLKSFDGKKWDWEVIEEVDGFPDDLLLEVLGSRKKTIFVEGDNGSHDVSLYRALFSDFQVIPRGSCSVVISEVKALRGSNQFHHLDIIGIIDRDRRVDEEITTLNNDGIYVLDVAEVENLFCTEEVLSVCSHCLGERNAFDDFEEAKKLAFKALQSEIENQSSLRAISEVKFRLNVLDEKAKGSEGIKSALESLVESINIQKIYRENFDIFENILESSDYKKLMKFYNRKTLSSQIGAVFDLKPKALLALVVRLANNDKTSDKIKDALRPYFANIPVEM